MLNDLWTELQQKRRQLDACIKELRKTGTKWAEAERDYRVALSEQVMHLKADGMAVGLINLVARGLPKIAKLRFERDIALVVYNANQEAINATKLEMRLIDNQISREYSTPQAGM